MTTTSKLRWTKVDAGWYSSGMNAAGNYAEVINEGGTVWSVRVNEVLIGMVETLAGAKQVALAARAAL